MIKSHSTTCAMDCPDSCALEVTVEDGRVERIRGGSGHPDTNGFICSKVARFAKRVYHPERLLHPLKRSGSKGEGEFVRISWDEAVQEVTTRLRSVMDKWGGEAILPYHYGGSNGLYSDGFIDTLYFARLGASRLAVTLCAAPTTAVAEGMYGRMPGVAFEDYPKADFILIWGGNPRASNIHLVPYLKEAKKKGAFVAVVDPVLNLSSDLVDLHLPVFPGTDLPVALAMIRRWREKGMLDRRFLDVHCVGLETLLEKADAWPMERAAAESRVDAERIRGLTDAYARRSPAVLRCGWGLERNRNGGHAVAAVLAMPAVLGKFGSRGGGYTLSNSGAAGVKKSDLWAAPTAETRVVNMTELGRALNGGEHPPIRALFVYNCNPLVTVPDQNAVLRGLMREDLFTVVYDQVMTDTARYADIVLPATTFLEHHDIRKGYGSYVVGGIVPVIDRVGESRPNAEVFAELGRAMGFDDEAFAWDGATALARLVSAIDLWGNPGDAEVLASGRIQRFDFPGPSPVQFETVRPRTRDAKVDLAPAVLGPDPYRYRPLEAERYPLAFLSPASSKTINSTLAEWSLPELHLTLHPRDAEDRGIHGGDKIRVFNDLGEIVCRARLSEAVRPGVVVMPKGAWLKSSYNGRTSTAVCPADVSEIGGGACYNDSRVEVEPVE